MNEEVHNSGIDLFMEQLFIECGTVMMPVVGMVICWGFDALAWSCLMCDLGVVCCVSCIALVM